MVSAIQFLHQTLLALVGAAFFFLFSLFRCIATFLFRNTKKKSISVDDDVSEGNSPKEPEREGEVKKDLVEVADSENDDEEEKQEFSFTFKFPSFEEFTRSKKENGDFSISELDPTKNTSQCESSSLEMSFSGFVKEVELISSGVDEFIADTKDDSIEAKVSMSEGFVSDKDLKRVDAAVEVNHENAKENLGNKEEIENPEAVKFVKDKAKHPVVDNNFRGVYEESTSEGLSYSEKDSLFTSSDSESTSLGHVRSVMSRLIDSYSDGFLSDGDFEAEFELDGLMNVPGKEKDFHGEMSDSEENWETEEFDEEDSDMMEELDQMEREHPHPQPHHPRTLTSDFLSEDDFHENLSNIESGDKDDNPMNGPDFSEKLTSENKLVSESSDGSKLETLWEHQELIEQLQMELKKVKAIGLPTILEESESPKIMEDLKPWRIDDKFHHEDCMDELHKIYKSYKERMRKLDILNYQKMYAIGFLQLKDPLESITSQKSSGRTLKSLVSQNFRLLKNKRHDNSEPMTKFIKELQSDLEVVYVGQICLSWEFLHWQYDKALELWDSDPRGIHQYNEVADEFQQFQVLMQRFLEDEPLQGPRIQHYIKSRCVLRNLLHVPVIREDGLKDKRKARKREKGEYAITSEILVEILEESIRIFWRFIRVDKDCSIVALKGQRETSVELQNPGDLELLVEVKKTLLKKERKLKELLRGQNCILRRFKKGREDDDSDQVLYFFSQVDMKLVTRVLNMSRLTTDQLVWCLNKLSKISFVSRKIHVEPSFSLFPC